MLRSIASQTSAGSPSVLETPRPTAWRPKVAERANAGRPRQPKSPATLDPASRRVGAQESATENTYHPMMRIRALDMNQLSVVPREHWHPQNEVTVDSKVAHYRQLGLAK